MLRDGAGDSLLSARTSGAQGRVEVHTVRTEATVARRSARTIVDKVIVAVDVGSGQQIKGMAAVVIHDRSKLKTSSQTPKLPISSQLSCKVKLFRHHSTMCGRAVHQVWTPLFMRLVWQLMQTERFEPITRTIGWGSILLNMQVVPETGGLWRVQLEVRVKGLGEPCSKASNVVDSPR
jgi:hypothetical protein